VGDAAGQLAHRLRPRRACVRSATICSRLVEQAQRSPARRCRWPRCAGSPRRRSPVADRPPAPRRITEESIRLGTPWRCRTRCWSRSQRAAAQPTSALPVELGDLRPPPARASQHGRWRPARTEQASLDHEPACRTAGRSASARRARSTVADRLAAQVSRPGCGRPVEAAHQGRHLAAQHEIRQRRTDHPESHPPVQAVPLPARPSHTTPAADHGRGRAGAKPACSAAGLARYGRSSSNSWSRHSAPMTALPRRRSAGWSAPSRAAPSNPRPATPAGRRTRASMPAGTAICLTPAVGDSAGGGAAPGLERRHWLPPPGPAEAESHRPQSPGAALCS
jgi:hypothetical protein